MTRPLGSTQHTDKMILDILDQHNGEICGTGKLIFTLNYSEKSKRFILNAMRRLAKGGKITITKSSGGCGYTTHYKRNRAKGVK